MTGTKTSVWLGEDLHSQWKASGDSLTEIVKRGLVASKGEAEKPATTAEIARLLDERLAPILERLDALPDTSNVRHMIRTELDAHIDAVKRVVRAELERVAGQSHA